METALFSFCIVLGFGAEDDSDKQRQDDERDHDGSGHLPEAFTGAGLFQFSRALGELLNGGIIGFSTIDQLKRALAIEEQIEQLRNELRSVLSGTSKLSFTKASTSSAERKDGRSGKRSAATRAKMAAAQQARWAKKNGPAASPEPATLTESNEKPVKAKKKRVLSPEARAKIVAGQKKRWAKVKVGK